MVEGSLIKDESFQIHTRKLFYSPKNDIDNTYSEATKSELTADSLVRKHAAKLGHNMTKRL